MGIRGFLGVNKPAGPSSNAVVQRVRGRLGRRVRVGHCGTLDPAAEGVLVLAVGGATRLAGQVMRSEKEYLVTVRLGVETDTYDLAGTVLAEKTVPPLDAAAIEAGLAKFRGKIMQAPPPVSALKRGGEPLYAKVRRGETVVTEPRPAEFLALEATGFDGRDLQLRIVCGSGTYVRSLAHDLGALWGCGGAVAALTRTRVGTFTLADAVPLADLETGEVAPRLVDAARVFAGVPAAELTAAQALQVLHGMPVTLPAPAGGPQVLLLYRGRLAALAAATGKLAQPKTVLLAADDLQGD